MLRIYLPVTHFKEGRISITGEKARYLTTVLRCRKGEGLIVFGGEGNCLRTNIIKADRKEVCVEVLEKFTCDTESPINVVLVQGLLKGQKMDMVIQKATELGVKEVIPVITERSQPRETRKVTRWRKIAEEASRQSGRSVIPLIHEPIHFNDCISSLTSKGLIFYEEGSIKISEAISLLVTHPSSLNPPTPSLVEGGEGGFFVIIGPEGGFTEDEVAIAKGKGFIVTTLGKRILRAETAAISAITLVQFLLGDLG